jgi:hypothetical protein
MFRAAPGKAWFAAAMKMARSTGVKTGIASVYTLILIRRITQPAWNCGRVKSPLWTWWPKKLPASSRPGNAYMRERTQWDSGTNSVCASVTAARASWMTSGRVAAKACFRKHFAKSVRRSFSICCIAFEFCWQNELAQTAYSRLSGSIAQISRFQSDKNTTCWCDLSNGV